MNPVFVERRSPWVVFFLGVLLLMPGIWSESGITGQDEYWLSLRTPMETLERGTWFTPWVNEQPRLRKPPLLYWAILLNYKLFGIHLFSARIWGVLAGAGLATCSALLYRELFRKNGLLSRSDYPQHYHRGHRREAGHARPPHGFFHGRGRSLCPEMGKERNGRAGFCCPHSAWGFPSS